MLKTQAVQNFIKVYTLPHLQLYNPEMEVQVNVAQDNGIKSRMNKNSYFYTDNIEVWKHFRIPYNANIDAEYVDTELKFNLEKHVEAIGLTGWNWKKKQSHWFGYDIDSIINHKEGLSEKDIEHIILRITDIPYVTAIKSTSGKGIHLYIHLDEPIPTSTHTEHAAIARSLLGTLSVDACFNLNNSIDVCGMVLWIWHRKIEGNPNAFKLIKEATINFPKEKVPSSWRTHIDVICGKKRRIRAPLGKNTDDETLTSEEDQLFQIMAAATRSSPLDEKHKILLDWFKENSKRDWWWDSDHAMLVCHTLDLKQAHTVLGFKGVFYTNSSGSTEQNCYAFPSEDGSWVIRRHSRGVNEHPSWTVDPSGWTRCNYNVESDLGTCVRANGGLENASGDYVFFNLELGLKALEDLGVTEISDILKRNPVYESILSKRSFTIRPKKENKIILMFDKLKDVDENLNIQGFVSNKRGDRWERVLTVPTIKRTFSSPDHLIRHLVTGGEEAGWYIFTKKGWIGQQRCNVVTVLQSQTHSASRLDVEMMMSKAVLDPWELVNLPFIEEYPGNRQWNMDAACFSCEPKEGTFDTWNTILEHLGKNIDNDVKENAWCNTHEILTGRDYLLYWIASMLQRPAEPLPYLFFVGPQNCGKSTLHEALGLIIAKGYVRADNALNSTAGFNSEVANAVLCVVEETDLSKNPEALNRIKDWVTGKRISIRALYRNAYDIINTSHWIQCANNVKNCPILPGDTRIVPINVDIPNKEIPKGELLKQLEKEKKAFLYGCLNLYLPDPAGRLGIPCIRTSHKTVMEDKSESQLIKFMKEKIKIHLGKVIPFNAFYAEFHNWLDDDEKFFWTKSKVSKFYPTDTPYCKGRYGGAGEIFLGNILFINSEEANDPEIEECYTDLTGRIKRRICQTN